MSTEIGKTIDIYEQSMSLLQAKSELFVSEDQNNRQPIEHSLNHKSSQMQFQNWSTYIIKSLSYLMKNWSISYFMFQDLQSNNKQCIQQIANKLSDLKYFMTNSRNNKHLLSKQEQLIEEMQKQMKEWNQIQDPVVFYDIKRRTNLSERMSKKISQTKNSLGITKKSTAPMYMRKIQEELKSTIYSVYLNSVNIDESAKKKALFTWESLLQMSFNQNRNLKNIHYVRCVGEYKNEFNEKFYDLINRRSKLNKNLFLKYYQQLSALTKNIIRSWHAYLKSLRQLHEFLRSYILFLSKNKQDLVKREKNVINLFQKSSNTVSTIFRIDTPLKIISSLNQIFQIANVLRSFSQSINNFIIEISENIKKSEEYLKMIPNQITHRQKEFYLYSADDKNFIQAHAKAQFILQKKLIETYQSFLNEAYKIAKVNYKSFMDQQLSKYQSHEIAGLLSRSINSSQNNQHSGNKYSKSQFSMNSSTLNEKVYPKMDRDKNEKLTEIEQFIKKIQIFDPNIINWNRNNVFSCALGPKLLLHGNIAILPQGLYYESFFNKKNLFFGKTKLFIPRNQILQIGIQNTLIIFPDAVQIKTPAGSLYFHALGSRDIINNTLNQAYFPENAANQNQQASNASFLQCKQEQMEKFSQAEISDLLKQQEVPLSQVTVKNIKLGKFFKRYFSTETFQVRGQKYQNFKTYILLQIQAIEPKCTPLTPQPPSYFSYKNQQTLLKNYPKISERIHTYRKKIPKVPFLSSGGDGFCQDKQTYYWISPQILVINQKSTVKGFSLTQGMQILTKQIFKQQNNSVKMSASATIKFLTESSSNNLVKGPALSNLKDCFVKIGQQILKYQKGKQGRVGKNKGGSQEKLFDSEQLEEKLEKLVKENEKLKKYLKTGIIAFLFIYVISLLVLSQAFNNST